MYCPSSEVSGTGLVLELTLERAGLEPQGSSPVILQSHGPALLFLKGPFTESSSQAKTRHVKA